jgi:transcription elongation factor Elf1
MECPRCNGLMVLQSFFQAMTELDSWKCVNCGNILIKKTNTIEFDSYSLFYHQEKNRK